MKFNYPIKACWNSNFRASRVTEIANPSGALPLHPVGKVPINLWNEFLLQPLVQFNYPFKQCWNSNICASRGAEISKFSGALPLDPVDKCNLWKLKNASFIIIFLWHWGETRNFKKFDLYISLHFLLIRVPKTHILRSLKTPISKIFGGCAPRPPWGAYSAPRPLAV